MISHKGLGTGIKAHISFTLIIFVLLETNAYVTVIVTSMNSDVSCVGILKHKLHTWKVTVTDYLSALCVSHCYVTHYRDTLLWSHRSWQWPPFNQSVNSGFIDIKFIFFPSFLFDCYIYEGYKYVLSSHRSLGMLFTPVQLLKE